MVNSEFSSEFDILFNNIMSNQAPGLDDYEKSVFLTKAQEEIVLSLYNGKNPYGDSFEETEEIRRYFNTLVKTKVYNSLDREHYDNSLSERSSFFRLPEDLWFITYESADLNNTNSSILNVKVIPTSLDNYHRIKENPFKGPSKKRVLRLDIEDNLVELISIHEIDKYLIRYISKLSPIILEDLSMYNLSIDGISEPTECALNPLLHRAILDRAVKLAISSVIVDSERTVNNV